MTTSIDNTTTISCDPLDKYEEVSMEAAESITVKFSNRLSLNDQQLYLDMLQKLAVHIKPYLELEQVRKKLDLEVNGFFQNSAARFVLIRRSYDHKKEVLCIAVLMEEGDYLNIAQIAVHSPKEYKVLARRLLLHVQAEYPTKTLYGMVHRENTVTRSFLQELGAEEIEIEAIVKEDIERKSYDGWITYVIKPLASYILE